MLRDAFPKIITELPGPKSQEVILKRKSAIPSSIACTTPCAVDRAEGAVIQDLDGNIFLDFVGGIGVMNVGHSHPEVVAAIKKQAERYCHPQINTFHYSEYIDLADKLNHLIPGSHKKRTALFNSGSEAIDNVIKIARRYTGRDNIICYNGAFHGRTFMSMTLTSSAKPFKRNFGPLAPCVFRAPYPNEYRAPEGVKDVTKYCLNALREMLDDYVAPETVAAIIIEPIQGEGGFVSPSIDYIKGVRQLCDQYGILLIADEIQTGYCRTGRMFATDYWADHDIYPDITASAKSIAAGLPISAVTGRDEIMEACTSGELGGTYGGNPVACAAALTVLDILVRDNYAEKALSIGKKGLAEFRKWYDKYDIIGTYRGTGAMLSVEFVKDRESKEPYPEVVDKILTECKQNGLVLKNAGTYNQIIRLLTPLCVTDEQLSAGLGILEKAIQKFSV